MLTMSEDAHERCKTRVQNGADKIDPSKIDKTYYRVDKE